MGEAEYRADTFYQMCLFAFHYYPRRLGSGLRRNDRGRQMWIPAEDPCFKTNQRFSVIFDPTVPSASCVSSASPSATSFTLFTILPPERTMA